MRRGEMVRLPGGVAGMVIRHTFGLVVVRVPGGEEITVPEGSVLRYEPDLERMEDRLMPRLRVNWRGEVRWMGEGRRLTLREFLEHYGLEVE